MKHETLNSGRRRPKHVHIAEHKRGSVEFVKTLDFGEVERKLLEALKDGAEMIVKK